MVSGSVGIGGVLLVALVTPLQPAVPLGAIAIAVGISGSIALIVGVVPAKQAAKLYPYCGIKKC